MARKNDLAKLAALAGLGYALTSQYRNKVDLTEKDSNPDRKARPDSTEDRLESPGDTIKRSMGKAPLDDLRTDAASSGDEMSKYVAKNNSRANSASAQTPIVIPDNLQNLPTDESARSLKLRNPPVTITKKLQNLPENQSAKSLKDRNPPIVIPKGMENLPDVRTNFGSLVNPYPADNKAAAKANARQAAIEATNRHNEDQKAIMAERRRRQEDQKQNFTSNKLNNPDPLSGMMNDQTRGLSSEATRHKRGGAVKKMASGGMASSASRRGDGIATKGKTRGRIC